MHGVSGSSPRFAHRQRGFLLIVAVVLIVIAAAILSAMVYFSVTGNVSTVRHLGSKQSLTIADTGLERALRGLFRESTACTALTYNMSIGSGSFSTSGALYQPAATSLSVNITAADAVLPVASLAGYAPFGRVRVQTEEINYAELGTTAAKCAPYAPPCLAGAHRGLDGTTPAPHALGAAVAQNQCLITSIGSVGTARRTVQAAARPGAAIARPDASNSISPNGSVGSLTWSHTVSGTDRLLLVGISLRNNSNQTVSGVTYAGTAMTAVANATIANNVRVELWYLLDPLLGANNVVATLSSSTRAAGGSVSLTGVDQITPLELPAATNSGVCFFCTATASVNITTTTDNAWIIDVLGWRRVTNNLANIGGLGRVALWNELTGGGWRNGVGGAGASTEAPLSPPGTYTVDWTLNAAVFHTWGIVAVAVRPAGGGNVLFWREAYQ